MNLPICYYPTTVICVDDDPSFLQNFSLSLNPDLAYLLFSSPKAALKNIGALSEGLGYKGDIVRYKDYTAPNLTDGEHAVLVVDCSTVWKRIYRAERFSEVSVAIVDYAMPEMDGLSFCRKISKSRIKKIMLTGKADERVAVDAFNEGLIDGFVMKSDRNAITKIADLVEKFKKVYVEEENLQLENLLKENLPVFMKDEEISRHVQRVWERHDIVEYYLSINPPGYVAVTREGAVLLVIMMTPDDFRAHIEIVTDVGGPAELLQCLRTRSAVPYFWRSEGYFDKNQEWQDQVFEATVVAGDRASYAIAVVWEPPRIAGDSKKVVPYSQYLAEIDALGVRG